MPGIENFLPEQGDPTPKKAATSKGIQDFLPETVSQSEGTALGKATQLDVNAYLPYLKNGVNSDFNPRLKRAQNQSWYEQAAKTAGNAVINTATGLAEGIGYLGTLITEWGDDKNYSNALTKKMQEWHNPFGEVYREKPNQTFDLSDSAWWFENIQQLGESAGAFALEGAGLGMLFGRIASEAAGLVGKGSKLVRSGINGAAHVASAATLAYTEGAMSGYRTYDDAYGFQYDKLIKEGVDPKDAHVQAKHVAAKAAATTVQMNTIMNTGLGLTALAPMFKREEDLVEAYMKKKGAGAIAEGETLAQWKARLKAASFEDPELKKILMHRQGITSLTSEAIQEGIEEVNTQYAEQEGKRVGEGKSDRNLFDQLTHLDTYFSDVTNQEGALNFVLGAIGGVAQTVLLDHIPTKRILKYDPEGNAITKKDSSGKPVMGADGKPKYETKLVTAKAANEFGGKRFFESMRDAAVADIEHYQKLETNLAKAILTKNEIAIQNARDAMFQIGALDAITKGNTESWQQQYRNVGELDNHTDLGTAMQPEIDQLKQQLAQAPVEQQKELQDLIGEKLKQQMELAGKTEAIQAGYAKDMNDHAYKAKAAEAVADLKTLQDMHEGLQAAHFDTFNPASGALVDHLFLRKSDLFLRQRALEQYKAKLDSEEFATDSNLIDGDLFHRHLVKTVGYMEAWDRVNDRLNDDISALQKAMADGDTKTLMSFVQKYRAQGFDESDLPAAVRNMVDTIKKTQERYKERIAKAEADMQATTGYTDWVAKNPGKTFKDYTDTVVTNKLNVERRANYDKAHADYLAAQSNFDAVISPKGQKAFMTSVANDQKKMVDAINERNKNANLAILLRQQEREAAAKIGEDNKRRELAEVEEQLKIIEAQLQELKEKITTVEDRIAEKIAEGRFMNFNTIIELRQQETLLKGEYNSLQDAHTALLGKKELYDVKVAQAAANTSAVNAAPEAPRTAEDMEAGAEDEDSTQDEDVLTTLFGEPVVPKAQSNVMTSVAEQLAAALGVGEEEIQTVQNLPDLAKQTMDELEKELTGKPFSYDAVRKRLAPLVTNGIINQATATSLSPILKQSMEAKSASVAAPPVSPVTVPVTPTLIPSEGEPDSFPVIFNADLFSESGVTELVHSMKTMTTDAIKGNFSSLEYREFILDDKRIVLRNVMNEHGNPILDSKVDTRLMEPNGLTIGTEVTLSVDTEWSGEVNDYDNISEDEYGALAKSHERFSDFTDENGKIGMEVLPGQIYPPYANMPIKIVAANGIVTYLPKLDWITAQQTASNFRNVADSVWDDTNKTVIDNNVQTQALRALGIRRIIAERYNANAATHGLKTRVTDRTDGHLMHSGTLNLNTGKFKYKNRTVAKQLPDPNLQFGIMDTSGNLFTAKGVKFSLPITPMSKAQQAQRAGAPVVYIPLANGRFQPVPLETRKFESRQADVTTMLRAIELYLLHGTEEGNADPLLMKQIDAIEKHTGFKLSTDKGLREFINQYYTYTSDFEDGLVRADAPVAPGGKKVNRFMFAIPKNNNALGFDKTLIKVGTSFSGGKAVYAKLENGKLSSDFVDAFTVGVSTRFKNVALADTNLRGMNSSGKFTEIRIQSDGSVHPTYHENYNAYLKTFTYTSVYGGHQSANGTYIYSANAQVQIDDAPLWKGKLASTQQTAATLITGSATTPATTDVTADEEGFILNNVDTSSTYVMQIVPEGNPVNLTNLELLRNITPDSSRNGLEPEEVLAKLQHLGITHLAEGYNPFIKCS